MPKKTLEQILKETQLKLAEKTFWQDLLEHEWPFASERTSVDDSIAATAIKLLSVISEKRIAQLESADGIPELPNSKPVVTDEKKQELLKSIEEARKLGLLEQSTVPQGTTLQSADKFVPQQQIAVDTSALKKGSVVELPDIEGIRSINPTHAGQFVPGDKVKVADVYADRTTGAKIVDILKKVEGMGIVRATVPIDIFMLD